MVNVCSLVLKHRYIHVGRFCLGVEAILVEGFYIYSFHLFFQSKSDRFVKQIWIHVQVWLSWVVSLIKLNSILELSLFEFLNLSPFGFILNYWTDKSVQGQVHYRTSFNWFAYFMLRCDWAVLCGGWPNSFLSNLRKSTWQPNCLILWHIIGMFSSVTLFNRILN